MAGDSGSLIVTFEGRRYDIGKFAERHPGGEDLLRKALHKDVGDYLRGKGAVDGKKHEHSANAYRILEKYCLDKKTPEEEGLVDLDKPIVFQVGRLGEEYWEWIHKPVDKDLRMFHSSFLEYFSRTHWFLIPLVWLPFVVLFSHLGYNSLKHNGYDGSEPTTFLFGLLALGVVWWTWLEYCLHRFAFHWRPSPQSYWQITLHFLLHGLHHKTPMDKGRLVFPPPLGAFFVAIVFGIHLALLPRPVALCLSAGTLFGYVGYDVIHYYLHHGTPPADSYMHSLKHYHHNHHFKNPDLSYGITSKLWDIPFGTVGDP
jgi:4-hydroxysphinganine ceramide fatty acyl 2-hydroxylase